MSGYSATNARRDLAWLLANGAVIGWEQVAQHPAVFELRPAGGGALVRFTTPEVRAFWRGVMAGARAARDESLRRVPRIGVG